MRRRRTKELPLTDFEGRTFGSHAEMAAFYGIDANLLHARWRYGKMSLKECLTKPVNKHGDKGCYDHEGRYFKSQKARAAFWHVNANAVRCRLRFGWTLKKALLYEYDAPPDDAPKTIKDHTGREFATVSEMCRHWGVRQSVFHYRMNTGNSLKQALTAPAAYGHPRQIQDHTGRWFKSHKELCEFWGVNYGTFNSRYNRGLKMKDCISNEDMRKRRKNGH